MRGIFVLPALAATLLLGGCIGTVKDVVTAPVRVVGGAVDLLTTSQSERDEKRGREMRKREEELGRLQRRYDDQLEDCDDGKRGACEDAGETYDEIQELRGAMPPPPPGRND